MILRLISLIRKEFIQIKRDPRTLGLTLAYPVAMLFVLGYAITNDVRNIPLAVLDRDQSSQSRALLDAYRAADYFRLDYFISSEDEMRYLIESNKARAAIIIPPDYGKELTVGRIAHVAFIIDGSDPNVAATALSAAILVGQAQSSRVLVERASRAGRGTALTSLPVDVRAQVWYNPGMVTAYYMIPALIGMILQFLTTFLTSTSIVRERERGTIEQLIVTPIRSWELVAGKLVPYVLIAFFVYDGNPGGGNFVVPGSNQRQYNFTPGPGRTFLDHNTWAWTADFDCGQHAAGGDVNHHVYAAAGNISLGLLIPTRCHAHYPSGCQLCDSLALFSHHRSRDCLKRCWPGRAAA